MRNYGKKILIGLFVVLLSIGAFFGYNKTIEIYESKKSLVKEENQESTSTVFESIGDYADITLDPSEYTNPLVTVYLTLSIPDAKIKTPLGWTVVEDGKKFSKEFYQNTPEAGEWLELELVDDFIEQGDIIIINGEALIKVLNIDDTVPEIINFKASNIDTSSITVVAEATDNESGIKGYYYSKDDGETYTEILTENTYTFTGLNKNTDYNIKTLVESNVGLKSTSTTLVARTLDITPPTYTPSTANWTNEDVLVTINYPAEKEESWFYEYTIDGQTWNEVNSSSEVITFSDNGYVIARIRDAENANNSVEATTFEVLNIDRTEAELTNLILGNVTSSSVTVVAEANDDESGIKGYYYSKDDGATYTELLEDTYTFTGLDKNTTYNIKVKVENNASIITESSILSATTTEISMPLYEVSNTNWTTEDVEVTITYPNEKEANWRYEYTIDGQTWNEVSSSSEVVTFSENGYVIARIKDIDNEANTVTAAMFEVTNIDKNEPSITSVNPVNIKSNSITVDVEASAISGIKGYYYSIDDGATYTELLTSKTHTFRELDRNTTYNIKVKTESNVELTSISNSLSVTTVNIDKPTYQSSNTEWTSEDVLVTINYPIEKEANWVYEYTMDGQTWNEASGTNEIVTFSANGYVTARVRDVDNDTNTVTSDTFYVNNIEKEAPIITNMSSVSRSSNIRVVVRASATSGIKGYYYSIDDGATYTESLPDSAYLFSGLNKNTTYNIKVKVENNAGLFTISDTLVATTTNIPTPTYEVSNEAWTSEDVLVTINYPEVKENNWRYEYTIDGQTWNEVSSSSEVVTFSENGYVIARVRDTRNNLNTVTTEQLTINNIDKTLPSIINVNTTNITSSRVSVVVDAVDLESGIKGYYYSIDDGATYTDLITNNKYTFTKLDKNKAYNVKVKVEDNAGFSTISIPTPVQTTDIPMPTYEVSNETWTNEDVLVTINYPVEKENLWVYEYTIDGQTWNEVTGVSEVITFSENGYVIARVRDRGNGINTVKIRYNVRNIDKEVPVLTLEYTPSLSTPTKNDIVLLLTSTKNITEISSTLDTRWKRIDAKTYQAIYKNNVTEEVTIKDRAGNTAKEEIVIENIDKVKPELVLTYSTTELTNQNVKVTVKSTNKKIVDVAGWTRVDEYTLERFFARNITNTYTFRDELGNIARAEIVIGNIDKVKPELVLTYSTEETTNQNVKVTVKSTNKKIVDVEDWTRVDEYTLEREFDRNITKNYIFSDELGNASKILVDIKWIDKVAPKLNLNYSTTEPTREDVIATITSNEKLRDLTDEQKQDGWVLSEDKLTMVKTYTLNSNSIISVVDMAGNTKEIRVRINWIDKSSPRLLVSYSTTEKTREDIVVTITSNKPLMDLIDEQKEAGWTLSEDKLILTKTYTENKREDIEFQDYLGNTGTAKVRVTNIDRVAPRLSVSYSITEKTKEDIVVTITSNKPLMDLIEEQKLNGWLLSEDKLILTKTYSENKRENLEFQDYLGNTGIARVRVINIDKIAPKLIVSYSATEPTKEDVIVTIVSNEELRDLTDDQKQNGWILSEDKLTLTRTYTANDNSIVAVVDIAGNIRQVRVNITWIDKTLPELSVNYSTTEITKEDVEVTITSNKILMDLSEEQKEAGWTLSEDKTTLTKTYTENKEESLEFQDYIGNVGTANINISNIDKIAPKLSVNYSATEPTKEDIVVTITSNKPLMDLTEEQKLNGWILSEDKTILTKTYTENKEEELEFQDYIGNVGKISIKVSNIDKIAPKLSLNYSATEPTKEDVEVTITSDKALMDLSEEQKLNGWILSEDKKTLTKTYTENKTETLEFQDQVGNTGIASISISNIDKTLPGLSVNYSTTEPTKEDVVVTIVSNKILKSLTDEQKEAGWTLSEDTITLTKTYSENKTETLEFQDYIGNVGTASISISNIDKTLPELSVSYSVTEPTNENILVTITSNKTLMDLTEEQKLNGWLLSEDKTTLTKTYSENKEEELEFQDYLGNIGTANIKISNIDKVAPNLNVSYSATEPTKEDVEVTITSDKALMDLSEEQKLNGWILSEDKKTLTKTYTENKIENLEFQDQVGNTGTASISISNIDKTLPGLSVNYSTTEPTKENVVVTIVSNKILKSLTDEQKEAGWSLSEDTITLTKTYSENKTETLEFQDYIGNVGTASISISNIDKTLPELSVSYSLTEPTKENVVVTIISNKPLMDLTEEQKLNGWILSEDKVTLTKTYTENKIENLEFQDYIGNVGMARILVSNIDKVSPKLTINYSTIASTKEDVVVTITANEKLRDLTDEQKEAGWVLSEDKVKVTKTYALNTGDNEALTVIDLAGNFTVIKIEITNIDKVNPVVTTAYSTTELTNQDVVVTITSNKDIQSISGWTKVNNREYKKTYAQNVNENITVKDLVGNGTQVNILINNINKTPPIMSLNGQNNIEIPFGIAYQDAGVIAKDINGNVLNVSVTSSINVNKLGEQTVVYEASDSYGNKATIKRSVNVITVDSSTIFRNISGCSQTGDCYNKVNEDNYVWYSGYLWRVIKINSDGTVKLVSEDSLSGFSYGADSKFSTSYVKEWLDLTFYRTLNNSSKIISTAKYCSEMYYPSGFEFVTSENARTTCNNNSEISANIALLTVDEYALLGGSRSYLNNGNYFFTMTPSHTNYIWTVDLYGNTIYYDTSINSFGVRPVITIYADSKVRAGDGTKNNPYRLNNDTEAKENSLLNARYTGEYVSFAGNLWRIIKSGSSTKLILDNYYAENNNYVKIEYGSKPFNTTDGIGYYLNNNVYNNMFGAKEKSVLDMMYLYANPYEKSQNPRTTTLSALNDNRLQAYVGLASVGDVLSAMTSPFTIKGFTTWTVNYNPKNKDAWFMASIGSADHSVTTDIRGIRPVINLNSRVKIEDGSGTFSNPYILSY